MHLNAIEPRQLDAIREIVNIGAGHAATHLSTLTGLRVMISVPRIQWGESAALVGPVLGRADALVLVRVPIGGAGGENAERASLILTRATALRMIGLMLRREPPTEGALNGLERSTLHELGNILCAAYVGVLGSFSGRSVMIGTPELFEGEPASLQKQAGSGLIIETDFSFLDTTFEGVFVLSHAEVALAPLLESLGLAR